MTISERIFERLKQIHMTQKEFAGKAGIKESAISEWKKNKTNPSSDKILAICTALDVTPEWLLSGVDPAASRGKNHQFYVVEADTDSGTLLNLFNQLDGAQRESALEYLEELSSTEADDLTETEETTETEQVKKTEKKKKNTQDNTSASKRRGNTKGKKKPSEDLVRYVDEEPDEYDDDDEIAAMFGDAF